MRNCSHFEDLFDAYLEGTQSHGVRLRVDLHLTECSACRDFLADLRIIDGLLVRTPQIDPAINFTFAVMAEVRSMPPPRRTPSRTWLWIASYLAFTWVALAAWMATGRAGANIALAGLEALRHLMTIGMRGLVTASHLATHQPTALFWAFGVLLVLDITLALVALTFYITVRPRLVAHLSRPERA